MSELQDCQTALADARHWRETACKAADKLERKLAAAEKALQKINDIRNSIVGMQTVNFSEHVYPLVAALNEAGIEGENYPVCLKYFGSLIERAVRAEKVVEAAGETVSNLDSGNPVFIGRNYKGIINLREALRAYDAAREAGDE